MPRKPASVISRAVHNSSGTTRRFSLAIGTLGAAVRARDDPARVLVRARALRHLRCQPIATVWPETPGSADERAGTSRHFGTATNQFPPARTAQRWSLGE